jgi:hypothetical protein
LGASSRAVDRFGSNSRTSRSVAFGGVRTRMRAAHRSVRGESPFPARAVRAVRAVGQDGLAIRTGQLRSIRPRLTRSWCGSRLCHEPLDSALRGWRLAAPRVTDRPRLIGWCSLHLTRPDLRHPSSSSRAPPCRFQDRQEAGATRVALRRARETVSPSRPRSPRRLSLRIDVTAIRMPSVVSRRIGSSPTPETWPLFLFEKAGPRPRAPFSPRSRRPPRQRGYGVLLGQRRSNRFRLSARRMGRTRDASDRHLPSHHFVPVPAPRRFRTRRSLAQSRAPGRCLISRQGKLALAGQHVNPVRGSSRRALSSRRDACGPSL